MIEPLAMCMGYHGRACDDCERLARDNQDEDSERWIEEEETRGKVCRMFKQLLFR